MRQKQRRPQHPRKYYRKRHRQRGGFLNRYDFAYTGRYPVDQVGKIAPGLTKNASSEINDIVQQQTNRAINQGEREIKHVLPKILHGAVEEVYQMWFRLLGKFGQLQLQKIKNKIFRR